jgi:hypothetical protein
MRLVVMQPHLHLKGIQQLLMDMETEQASTCKIGCPVRAEISIGFLMDITDARQLCDFFATQLVLRETVLETCPMKQAAKMIMDAST